LSAFTLHQLDLQRVHTGLINSQVMSGMQEDKNGLSYTG